MSAVAVENARLQWEDGYRRLNEYASDRPTYERLLAQVDVADRRAQPPGRPDLHARRAGRRATTTPTGGCSRCSLPEPGAVQLGLVEDAAFHLYARGAVDYAP